ncbi:C-type mannose receptor 2-like [Cebidichthys violaceus]|uniref:C-type mannose receptor 2-like n=1 Tax=Cebidichthys violaceus TaxID=271503 RepID=UPI0035CA16B6
MQWSLFVLIMMGQCSFCLCRFYHYHFVKENKTWKDAQIYCKKNYTDLAKVFDMTDVKRLNDSASNQNEAWIGLYNKSSVNRTWFWSLPGVEFNDSETKWRGDEPNDKASPENCVVANSGNKWNDDPCNEKYPFVCYNETNQNQFYFINESKNWLEAQSCCREQYTDLVSGQLNDSEFKTKIKSGENEDFWIGLFRDTWRWSDGSNLSFRSWDPMQFQNEDGKKCAMTMSNGKWSSDNCNKTKPFFCYDNEVILIKKNKTWEQALTYCRKNHRELVSITDPQKQGWVAEIAKGAETTHVWTGLRYTCTLGFWFWVSDETVLYKNWELQGEMDECDMSGAMKTGGEHTWSKKDASMEFNFICTKY